MEDSKEDSNCRVSLTSPPHHNNNNNSSSIPWWVDNCSSKVTISTWTKRRWQELDRTQYPRATHWMLDCRLHRSLPASFQALTSTRTSSSTRSTLTHLRKNAILINLQILVRGPSRRSTPRVARDSNRNRTFQAPTLSSNNNSKQYLYLMIGDP